MKYVRWYLIPVLYAALFLIPFPATAEILENLGEKTVAAAEKALAPGRIDACLTNADSAALNSRDCRVLLDVFSKKAGVSIGKGNLLTVHRARGQKPWAAFISHPSSRVLNMVLVKITDQGPEISGPLNIRVDKGTDFSPFKQAFGQDAFSLVSLANGWADQMPPELISASLFHDHLCCGVFTGLFTAQYILEQFPLAKGQRYIYIGTPAWCQDDMIMDMLNLTPGKRGYATMVYPWNRPWKTRDGVYKNLGGIIVRKNQTGGGQAWVLSFDWHIPEFLKYAGLCQKDMDWKKNPWLHVVYNRFAVRHLDRVEDFVSVVKTRVLDSKEEVDSLVRLGANPLEILLGKDESWPQSN